MEISATIILIGITVLISYQAWNKPELLNRLMFTPYLIKNRNQWDRFVLSGFIHKDSMHLLFNMFTFYFFGRIIEMYLIYRFGMVLGIVAYVLFYIAAIVLSDIPTYLKHKENSHYRALGASGGVAAAVFGSILIMPLSDICLFGLLCLPGFILGILFLAYTFYQAKKGNDGINHDAHLYGALFGIAFILVVFPQSGVTFIQEIIAYRPF